MLRDLDPGLEVSKKRIIGFRARQIDNAIVSRVARAGYGSNIARILVGSRNVLHNGLRYGLRNGLRKGELCDNPRASL